MSAARHVAGDRARRRDGDARVSARARLAVVTLGALAASLASCGHSTGSERAASGEHAGASGSRSRSDEGARGGSGDDDHRRTARGASSRPARYVLIRDDAWLHTAPSDAAAHARARPTLGAASDVSVFRLLEDRGEWLVVEPTERRVDADAGPDTDARALARASAADSHGARAPAQPVPASRCHPPSPFLAPLAVRFYVRRSALAPVVARSIDVRFDDGTSLHLVPGVVAIARAPQPGAPAPSAAGDALYYVDTGHVAFELEAPPSSVASSFTRGRGSPAASSSPSPPPPQRAPAATGDAPHSTDGAAEHALAPGAVLTFGSGRTLRVSSAGGASLYAKPRPHEPSTPADAAAPELVAFEDGCGRYEALARREDLLPVTPDVEAAMAGDAEGGDADEGEPGAAAHGSPSDALESRPAPVVRAGAVVRWPDGTRAGSTRIELRMTGGEADDPSGARRCFWYSLEASWPGASEPSSDSLLKLCFDRSDVRQAPAPAPSHRWGDTGPRAGRRTFAAADRTSVQSSVRAAL